MPNLAYTVALLSSLQLFLDVLRGPLFTHFAGGGVCQRKQDTQMVLPAWLANSGPNHGSLRLQ